MALTVSWAIALYLISSISTKTVLGIKPHFTSEPDKLIVAYPEETVKFTWKLSNRSINNLYFGTWQHGTVDNTIMSIVRNGSETPIYTSEKEKVKEYRGRVRWTGDLSMGVVSFELTNIKQTDQKYYGIEIEFDNALMTEVSGFTQLVVKSKSVVVKGTKPHFTSEPDKLIVAYPEETVKFTWKLSNHSINTLYFGTWQADFNTLGNTIMSIVRNGSETPIHTSEKEKVKEYRGRVRWTGDLSMGVVSFELTNIKQTDQKYYGIEIEFDDDSLTEVSNFTQLIVKTSSVFTSAPSDITQAARGSASFTWKYSLTAEDQGILTALVFGVHRKDTYGILCTIQIREKAVISSNCSTDVRKAAARYASSTPMRMATFVLDNLSPEDKGIYSLRLKGTRELMENKTRLFVRGTKPHFTSEPDKLIVAYPEETVKFTWKLSNHSINTLYFGTWQADFNTLGNTIMSIVRNGSETLIYTSEKEKVKEYRGRVRWTGDLSMGVVSFELTNIKQTDQKYYGIEIEFNDAMMTEVSGFTQLVVKSRVVKEKTPCEVNNGGCSHVCVLSSVTKTHTCKCPTGMDLSSDGKTCVVVPVPTTVQPSPPRSGADIDKGPTVKVFLFVVVASIIIAL